MSTYALRQVLQNSPEKIKNTIAAVVGVVLALATNIEPTLLETVGTWFALERLLDLFYVTPVRAAQESGALEDVAAFGKAEMAAGVKVGQAMK